MRLTVAQARALGVPEDQLPKEPKKGKGGRESPIQQRLWDAIEQRWPSARPEYTGAVPGRNFEIDAAFPAQKLAVEVDGWTYHGKFLQGFKHDRERQNLLTLNGWRILRFTAADIWGDLDGCLEQIDQALKATPQRHKPRKRVASRV